MHAAGRGKKEIGVALPMTVDRYCTARLGQLQQRSTISGIQGLDDLQISTQSIAGSWLAHGPVVLWTMPIKEGDANADTRSLKAAGKPPLRKKDLTLAVFVHGHKSTAP